MSLRVLPCSLSAEVLVAGAEGGGSDSGRVCGQEGLDGSVLTGRSQSGPLCWGPRQPGGGEEGGEQAAVSQSDTATLSWSFQELGCSGGSAGEHAWGVVARGGHGRKTGDRLLSCHHPPRHHSLLPLHHLHHQPISPPHPLQSDGISARQYP